MGEDGFVSYPFDNGVEPKADMPPPRNAGDTLMQAQRAEKKRRKAAKAIPPPMRRVVTKIFTRREVTTELAAARKVHGPNYGRAKCAGRILPERKD